MLAYCRRAVLAALLLSLSIPAVRTHAAPVELYDGMAVQLSGFTPAQEQVIRNGLALFDDMASPALVRPPILRMSAVPGTTSTTHATWQTTITTPATLRIGVMAPVAPVAPGAGSQFVDVWITFGTDRLGVGQLIHEMIHVLQVENPAWGDAERAYAAAHPYPESGMGAWLDTPAPEPESELCPRVTESLYEPGAGMAAYVETQPGDVRWCLAHLAG